MSAMDLLPFATFGVCVAALVLVLFFVKAPPPKPSQRGEIRVIGKYGGRVEICDGKAWRPTKIPESLIDLLIDAGDEPRT